MKSTSVILGSVLCTVLLVTGCGGGGDDDAPSNVPSGACAPCGATMACEDGLVCQACQGECSGTERRCSGHSSSTAEALSCDGTSYPGGCINVAGRWTVTESVEGECTIDGESEDIDQEGTASVQFTQTGCDVSYSISNEGVTVSRSGKVVGNRMRLTGPFLVARDGSVSIGKNQSVVDGAVTGNRLDLRGLAEADGKAQGKRFTCTGTSRATGTRS